MDYPSNSQSKKREPAPKQEPKVVTKIVTGEVVRQKQSLGKRFKELFVGGDAQSVWSYVAYDILIPAVKDTVSDAVSMGLERMLFGEGIRSPSRRGRTSSVPGTIAYNKFSPTSRGTRYPREEPRTISRRARVAHNFDEITLDSRVEAEAVITQLFDIIERYDQATVNDLYEMVGVTGDFTDEKYGWLDLRGAQVDRIRNGRYLLNLPVPVLLD